MFADAEGRGADRSLDGGLAARVDRAASEFAALVTDHRAAQTVDPFTDPTPFEQLLGTG